MNRESLGIFCLFVAVGGCDRHRPAQQVATTTTQPATTPAEPQTQPAEPGKITEAQLLSFVAASKDTVAKTTARSLPSPNPSPEGFAEFTRQLSALPDWADTLRARAMTPADWQNIGTAAWSAWSVAQVDYNAEAPLRAAAQREADAQRALATAQQTKQGGRRVLSADERAARIEKAKDEQAAAEQRADNWARRAADLQRQITDAEAARHPAGQNGPPAQPEPFGPPGAGGPPPFPAGPNGPPAPPGGVIAFTEQRRHELQVVRQHEADEREQAHRAAAVVADPVIPATPAETAALLEEAERSTRAAKETIDAARRERMQIAARLEDQRRSDRAERRKAASEADVALLQKHLKSFDEAWGMSIDGSPAPHSDQ